MAEEVLYSVADGVATITLNRPERLNALNGAMYEGLIAAFDQTDGDDRVRAVVVTGAGRAFCAGADLSGGAGTFDYGQDAANPEAHRDRGGLLVLRIFRSLKPVIAAINGPAVGVGVTMTLPMDIRIMADTARAGFVFARRGIVPDGASSWFLPRIVGISQALEWCLTGRAAQRARGAGRRPGPHGLPGRGSPAAGHRAGRGDRCQRRTGLRRAHPPPAVADAWRRPPDGRASDRLAGDLRHRAHGGLGRGGRRVSGEARALLDPGSKQGPARLVPLAPGAAVR